MTTKYSPYYLNYGFNPVFPKDLLNAANVETVKQTFFKLDEIRKLANDNITSAQQRQKYYVDNSRRVNVGDSVLLSTKNLKNLLPEQTKKLSKNFIGPFAQMLRINYSYQNIYDVFHISLLKPYVTDEMFTDRNDSRPDPEYNEEGEAEWEVERKEKLSVFS